MRMRVFSDDELFRQYKQMSEAGTQVAVYQCPFYFLPELIPALHEGERQRLRAQAVAFSMGKHHRLGAASAVLLLLDEEPTLLSQIFSFIAPIPPRVKRNKARRPLSEKGLASLAMLCEDVGLVDPEAVIIAIADP